MMWTYYVNIFFYKGHIVYLISVLLKIIKADEYYNFIAIEESETSIFSKDTRKYDLIYHNVC